MKKSKRDMKSARVILLTTQETKRDLIKRSRRAGLSVSSYLTTVLRNSENQLNDEPRWVKLCDSCGEELFFAQPNDMEYDGGVATAYHAYCGNNNCLKQNIPVDTVLRNGKTTRL